MSCGTITLIVETNIFSLALSARRPSYLDPKPLNDVLSGFLQCKYTQSTDVRLASLFRVAYGAHFGGCRPTTIESVEAFNKDVELIERSFKSSMVEAVGDTMSQHFPFISLHWYRLSYACAFLDTTDPTQRTGKALTWAIEWASQILIHLSKSPSTFRADKQIRSVQLEPDPSIVNILSFAIDHYFVVISYAAFFMVNSWLGNFIDCKIKSNKLISGPN
jgi:hypothetical protein